MKRQNFSARNFNRIKNKITDLINEYLFMNLIIKYLSLTFIYPVT